MDNDSDPTIFFDSEGICNHCRIYDKIRQKRLLYLKTGEDELLKIVEEIKRKGKEKEYDCIIGVSGGLDSSYVAYLCKELNLRPLAVHLDNGWNSDLAVKNIRNALDKLNIDLYTYVINWKEFRDLQMAYIRASVVDIEALTDHAIVATLFNAAKKFNVRYILSGENMETEGILPDSWVHMKLDHINIKAIHKRYGKVKRKTFPLMSYQKFLFLEKVFKIKYVPILNYVPYEKERAKNILKEKLNWSDYGGKHHESVFTRFYQSYILPKKFNIDKRKSHFSTLVCAGQMTRESALEEISQPPYPDILLQEEKQYILKKFDISEVEFDKIMRDAPIVHTHYPSIINIFSMFKKILSPIRRKNSTIK